MKNCSGINCPMQYGVVDAATCPAVECCPNATPPLTNYDRIRAMTNEELAEFITPVKCVDCHLLDCGVGEIENNKSCTERILDWLRKEAPDE